MKSDWTENVMNGNIRDPVAVDTLILPWTQAGKRSIVFHSLNIWINRPLWVIKQKSFRNPSDKTGATPEEGSVPGVRGSVKVVEVTKQASDQRINPYAGEGVAAVNLRRYDVEIMCIKYIYVA